MFQNKAILKRFNNFTHVDQLTMVTHGDPFSVVTLPRPGKCPVIVNFSMKLYNRNTCKMLLFQNKAILRH